MPNHCWNYLTFVSEYNPTELAELFDKEINSQNIPDDCLCVKYKGDNGIKLKMMTNWGTDNKWLLGLLDKYPNCWIKNDWYEEDGCAGIFIGGFLYGQRQKTIIEKWWELSIEGNNLHLGGSA
jgi:hypothetical protein|tara:strand:- start:1247 stop:1615 length:369 start_codon:yes stop_codon:yes gene_type:complete